MSAKFIPVGACLLMALLFAASTGGAIRADGRPSVAASGGERASLAFMRSVYRFGWRRARVDLITTRADGRGARLVVGKSINEGLALEYPGFLSFTRSSWSPDGERLAFTARSGSHLVNIDGSGLRPLDRSGAGPLWSPDGQTIVVTRFTVDKQQEAFFSSLWAMDPDGSNQRQLIPEQKFAFVDAGSFSPGGETLAFTRREFSHADPRKADIYTVGMDGGRMRKLAERASDPSYSPDGTRIAFATERDENGSFSYGHDSYFLAHELYVMDADGGNERRLTRTKRVNETAPAWSPDGARIAYRRGRNIYGDEEYAAVFAMNPNASCPTPISAPLKSRTQTRKGGRGRQVLRNYGAPAWGPSSSPGTLSC
jgi:dipeptidyl aminopeptidase/acylaminoacyl peptidase